MSEQEKSYIKGFNSGYILSKHDPELLNTLLKTPDTENPYLKGMYMGKKQHDREKVLEQIKISQAIPQNRDRKID